MDAPPQGREEPGGSTRGLGTLEQSFLTVVEISFSWAKLFNYPGNDLVCSVRPSHRSQDRYLLTVTMRNLLPRINETCQQISTIFVLEKPCELGFPGLVETPDERLQLTRMDALSPTKPMRNSRSYPRVSHPIRITIRNVITNCLNESSGADRQKSSERSLDLIIERRGIAIV
ncbi:MULTISPECIES: hypothetical protein [unclassified Mycobacterium]|uniref:hypothetical protein n=1 Tax=unclassified Mycobacterium TaxID=2642494 RepID=UPI00099427C2|nr:MULTISPECIES: hypothetical protein [unclassified Mycobacterium]